MTEPLKPLSPLTRALRDFIWAIQSNSPFQEDYGDNIDQEIYRLISEKIKEKNSIITPIRISNKVPEPPTIAQCQERIIEQCARFVELQLDLGTVDDMHRIANRLRASIK